MLSGLGDCSGVTPIELGVIEYRLITCLNKSSDKKKELLILLDNLFLFSEKVIKDYNENKDKYLANKEELSGYYYTHGKLNLLMGLIDSSLKSLEESGETFTEEEKEKIEKNEDRLDMNYIG